MPHSMNIDSVCPGLDTKVADELVKLAQEKDWSSVEKLCSQSQLSSEQVTKLIACFKKSFK